MGTLLLKLKKARVILILMNVRLAVTVRKFVP